VDLAAHITSVARLAAARALVGAPGFAKADGVSTGGCGVNVAFIVDIPCWVAMQVATVYVLLHGFYPRSKEVAVLVHAICLVEKKPVAGPKCCKEITLENTFPQVQCMDSFVSDRF
jgi:hypothetical protein